MFNAGVARQIRNALPWAFFAYMEKLQKEGWKLGDVQFVEIEKPHMYVANCATQHGYGYKTNQKVFVDYDAVSAVFATLVSFSEEKGIEVAMPRIGAGLAGGDWKKINQILQSAIQGHEKANITIYSLEP